MKNIVIDTASVYLGGTITDPAELAGLADHLLGTTKGGVSITLKPNIKDIEFDGKLERKVKGMSRVLGWEVSAECEVLELTEKVLNGSLMTKKSDSLTKHDKYVPSNELEYKDLVVVGKLLGTNDPIVAVIKNVYNSEGLSLETKDSDEATCKMSFQGHYTLGSDEAPCDFYIPKTGGEIAKLKID